MSYSITYNVPTPSDTGETIQTLKVDTAAYAVTKDIAGECQLTNISAPIGLPEVLTYRGSNLADIYANSGIDRALYTPSRRGVSINAHLRQTWSARDDSVPQAPQYAMPVTCSITLRIPQNEFITLQNVEQLYSKCLGMLFPNGSSFVAQMLRLALNPKE